jgi:hypothetical protein
MILKYFNISAPEKWLLAEKGFSSLYEQLEIAAGLWTVH